MTADCTLPGMRQANALQHRLALRQRRMLEPGKETQGFQAVQVVVEHDVLGQVAQVAARSPKTASAN